MVLSRASRAHRLLLSAVAAFAIPNSLGQNALRPGVVLGPALLILFARPRAPRVAIAVIAVALLYLQWLPAAIFILPRLNCYIFSCLTCQLVDESPSPACRSRPARSLLFHIKARWTLTRTMMSKSGKGVAQALQGENSAF